VEWLEKHEGAVIDWVPLDSLGRISVEAWTSALAREPETIAVATCLWANNEVGTIQPVTELAALAEQAAVPLHVDAVAMYGHYCFMHSDGTQLIAGNMGIVPGITALSVAGHKIGSVPGIGALFVARTASLEPLLHGGGQQRQLRSGTQNAPAAASMAAAVSSALSFNAVTMSSYEMMRIDAQERILASVDGVTVSGDQALRLPNNLHLVVEGATSADMLYLLDEAGFSVSAGSACQAGVVRPSHVLLAMGYSEAQALSTLRITFGPETEFEDVDALVDALPGIIAKARAVSSRT